MNNSEARSEDIEREETKALIAWYREKARPFLERSAPEKLSVLDSDAARLTSLAQAPENITVCFLGHSGIGKSTLLNAIAAAEKQVLPAGGIGPLTAQATEVHYDSTPSFVAEYHDLAHLRTLLLRLVFALKHVRQRPDDRAPSDSAGALNELDEATREELVAEFEAPDAEQSSEHKESAFKGYLKQAAQIITGNQLLSHSTDYLIDALRVTCGEQPVNNTVLDAADALRIAGVQRALKCAERKQLYERREDGDPRAFALELKDHAAGFLAPLIKTFRVGWPSDLLKHGVNLVDLPGVGIAQDVYRSITQTYIRDIARAVILVVGREGPTAEAVDLLRTSGYWNRLVGASDDPDSDPCTLLIAVTKVDDVAGEEWRNYSEDDPRPKKREVYTRLVDQFKTRMRAQLADQLGSIGITQNETVVAALSSAREQILATLDVHPVSATEYRKLLLNDEEERAFLSQEDDTGIPQLRTRLIQLATQERKIHQLQLRDVSARLRKGIVGELTRLEEIWRARTRAADIAEKLERELESFLGPKKKERNLRAGAFREYLEATAQTRIRELVLEARVVAQEEINDFLRGLRDAHWATLKAAVKRGGTFDGKRVINLPDDIAERFQGPVAAVWSQKLLKEIRNRTATLADDDIVLVEETCSWAEDRTDIADVSVLLRNQRDRVARASAQMKEVGKEAVTDLRNIVKQKLSDSIQGPIKDACKSFVRKGSAAGQGVKKRILQLFDELALKATKDAQEPAVKILRDNFLVVRDDIRAAYEAWGDPLSDTADLIVQRHSERVDQANTQERDEILSKISDLLANGLVIAKLERAA